MENCQHPWLGIVSGSQTHCSWAKGAHRRQVDKDALARKYRRLGAVKALGLKRLCQRRRRQVSRHIDRPRVLRASSRV